ncbi:MAG: GerMN domain-containing protein [Lachnospiraceae bacterium]|nr:GerMN domain-containing protein [Lachnospiraceae bacterium]
MKSGCRYLIFLLLLVFLTGCSSERETESEYCIYYLNKESTKIIEKAYEPQADAADTLALVGEFLEQLKADAEDVECKKTIPTDVGIAGYTLEESVLTIYFDNNYSTVEKIEEVLMRAAIVRTLTQIDGVDCLNFFVGDAALVDSSGNPVGVMTNDSFIENPGEQINSIQEATLVLYFASEDGKGLVKETQEIHYSSNISMEKLIMERLLKGPKSENAVAAIPSGTKLVNVSVVEGVCYVSLDEGFINQDYSIEEPVVIYSIVNSLTEISTISKVQISVNGDTGRVYRDSFDLDELYVRNLEYVNITEDTQKYTEEGSEVSE